MIAVQSNTLSLAGLFNIPQSRGCTGSRHSAKKSSQYLSKPDTHQPNICPVTHHLPDFRNQYAPAREDIQAAIPLCGERFSVAGGFQGEGFSDITTRRDNFVVAKKKDSTANAALSTTANEYQPFGSIPRDCNSLRRTRLIHVARDESPSLRISSSSCDRKSCANRNWYWSVLGLSVDIVITNLISSITDCNYNVMPCCLQSNKATPRTVGAVARRLTTTVIISNEEAVMQNTTHPQGRHSLTQNSGTAPVSFVWIIAAVRRDCPTVKATIHHIAAATEREARQTLAKDHVCFFAGRIRQEVSHA